MANGTSVLVTGAGGPSGKAAIRALKDKGFRVIAADMAPAEHGADGFAKVLPATHPMYAAQLDTLLSTWNINWLFPTVQEELPIVAEKAHAYRSRGIAVYMADPRAVAICNDKWLTAKSLAAAGVAVPRSVIGESGPAAIQPLGFPCVSKPRVGRGGRHVTVHDRADTALVMRLAGNNLIWQQFMPGTEYDVLLMIRRNRPASKTIAVVFEKTSLREGRTGNALALERVSAPDVQDLALSAARALDLAGPVDMDIRRDVNGVAHVLEINARIGAHTHKAPEIFDALVGLYETGYLGG
ncbi:ATP-grasp domain-containing protein [Oxalobacteraceae bacterium CAVE-383]|nr:ATP-grasp domain-containing protein [Oxalobacteraceae bacterium CAVE-383]